nr:phage tail tape measure C-terminal domain-containing protein [Robbsia betulipollinis]
MRDNVEHIKSLQQQGVINAATAIQQEHDERDAAYADQLKTADQEIDLAAHSKTKKALVEWQNKKKAIQAEITSNDRQTTDALAVLQAKELAATKAYTDGLSTALQARAEAIAAQNQGKTLGATDADALERATAAAKEYAEKYQALAKSLTENKISATQYDDEITALQEYERKRLALEAQATEQIRALNADGYAGAQKALADYAEAAQNKFSQVGSLVGDVAKNMEDALVTFASTGKLSFSSLATGVIADLARIGVKALELQAIQGVGSLLGSLFGSTGSSLTAVLGLSSSGSVASSVASSTSQIYSGTNTYGFADGGAIVGPGTGTSDSILARVSNGEGILTADAMKRFGVANLEAMNNGASINNLAKFATGGYVGSVAPSTATGGDIHVNAPVSVEGGSDTTANAAGAADLQKKIAAAVRAVVSNERKQGGALWKMKNGIA